MGCLSVKIYPATPALKADATIMGRPDQTKVSIRAPKNIKATASKIHDDTKVFIYGMNAGAKVKAWIICKASTSRMYLAVTEGWLLTINEEYISVRKA